MRRRQLVHLRFLYGIVLLIFFCTCEPGWSKDRKKNAPATEESSLADSVRQLQQQIQQLQSTVQLVREEAVSYREEISQLKGELQATRQKLDSLGLPARAQAGAEAQSAPHEQAENAAGSEKNDNDKERISKLEEDQQLLANKVEDQYQTKVESASKYRVKLSGIVLMNAFSNQGYVNHTEVPNIALPATPSLTGGNTGGSLGATLRQSEVGLEVYGPEIAGAKTRGNFVADFFGEFPETVDGTSAGSLRLRAGTVRLDWSRTSVIAGQDSIFFSPTYPTSFASLGIPALSYSGNLWAWIPQVRVEHHLLAAENSQVTLSAGIFDPLTGETPDNEFLRRPGAGESSRQPGYGTRLEWSRSVFGQPLTIGLGSYYNRENWGFNRNINGWAGTTDWNIPLGRFFSVSGKFYRGRAIGGLGAGVGRSVLANGAFSNPATRISPLLSTGGWTQIKFKPFAKLEFNAAAGQDNASAQDVRGFNVSPVAGYFDANLTRNQNGFTNFIFRPRSNLLFSSEFRALRTFTIDGNSQRANQVNLIMGVLF